MLHLFFAVVKIFVGRYLTPLPPPLLFLKGCYTHKMFVILVSTINCNGPAFEENVCGWKVQARGPQPQCLKQASEIAVDAFFFSSSVLRLFVFFKVSVSWAILVWDFDFLDILVHFCFRNCFRNFYSLNSHTGEGRIIPQALPEKPVCLTPDVVVMTVLAFFFLGHSTC